MGRSKHIRRACVVDYLRLRQFVGEDDAAAARLSGRSLASPPRSNGEVVTILSEARSLLLATACPEFFHDGARYWKEEEKRRALALPKRVSAPVARPPLAARLDDYRRAGPRTNGTWEADGTRAEWVCDRVPTRDDLKAFCGSSDAVAALAGRPWEGVRDMVITENNFARHGLPILLATLFPSHFPKLAQLRDECFQAMADELSNLAPPLSAGFRRAALRAQFGQDAGGRWRQN